MIYVDITMTATLRPELIKRTLESFRENLFYDDLSRYTLFLNVDPVGENVNPSEIFVIASKIIPNVICSNATKPSFSAAVHWTWSQTKSPYVFHLEDDWILNKRVDINNMIDILDYNRHLACLRMCKYDIPDKPIVSLFNSNYYYKKNCYFEAEDRKRQFGLNPVLIRKEFVKEAVPLMSPSINPEKQFRYENDRMRDFVMKWTYAIYGKPGMSALVTDIGSEWRKDNHFKKPDGKSFLEWEKE